VRRRSPSSPIHCSNKMRGFVVAVGIWCLVQAQAPAPRSLALYLLGHRVGAERYSTEARGEASVLTSHFEYTDRGTPVALDTTLSFTPNNFAPISFESHGKSYRYFSVDTSVPNAPRTANTFTLDGMAPLSAQAVLVQYW